MSHLVQHGSGEVGEQWIAGRAIDEATVQEGEPFDDVASRRDRAADRNRGGAVRKERGIGEADDVVADPEEVVEDRAVGVEDDDVLAARSRVAAEGTEIGAIVGAGDVHRQLAALLIAESGSGDRAPNPELGIDERHRGRVIEEAQGSLVHQVGDRRARAPSHRLAGGVDRERPAGPGGRSSSQGTQEKGAAEAAPPAHGALPAWRADRREE